MGFPHPRPWLPKRATLRLSCALQGCSPLVASSSSLLLSSSRQVKSREHTGVRGTMLSFYWVCHASLVDCFISNTYQLGLRKACLVQPIEHVKWWGKKRTALEANTPDILKPNRWTPKVNMRKRVTQSCHWMQTFEEKKSSNKTVHLELCFGALMGDFAKFNFFPFKKKIRTI